MPVGDSGIWPDIIGTGKRGSELGMVGDWSMGKGREEREISNNWTI